MPHRRPPPHPTPNRTRARAHALTHTCSMSKSTKLRLMLSVAWSMASKVKSVMARSVPASSGHLPSARSSSSCVSAAGVVRKKPILQP